MSEHDVASSRRRFLLSTTAAAVAAGSVGSLTGCGGGMPVTDAGNTADTGGGGVAVDTGLTVADVAVGSAHSPMDAAYIVARDASGIYAYSNVCTHETCPVPVPSAAGVSTCSCAHGSTYDANGDLRTAATTRPTPGTQRSLPHYAVTFTGTGATAHILVNTGSVVADRAARTMPPA